MTSASIGILLIEDHLLMRLGTSTLLASEEGVQVLGQAANGREGLELFQTLRPDVVILDMRMPGMDGIQVIEELKQIDSSARILVLTHYDGEESIFRALKAGALGYLTKETDAKTLFCAVRAVAEGKQFLPAQLGIKLADRTSTPALSPRELQVLQHIFTGLSNKDIGKALGISENTVGMFVLRLFAKLGVRSRTEAVSAGLKRGLLS